MMQFHTLEEFTSYYMSRFDAFLQAKLQEVSEGQGTLYEAMAYSLKGGGKRFRPLLMFASAYAAGGNVERTFPAAAALEMIHTYSLIHDDLPAMDDDDLRRGHPTNHKVYGEAAAILAGDALLTAAFEIILESEFVGEEKSYLLAKRLAEAAGPRGMVAGQIADIEGEEKVLTVEELQQVHIRKTGALIEYAAATGASIVGASNGVAAALGSYAHHLGLAFQIHNDLKDIMLDQEASGKTQGHDEDMQKNTYPSLLGRGGALQALEQQNLQALAALDRIVEQEDSAGQEGVQLLRELLKYVKF